MWQELGNVVHQEQLFPKSSKTSDVLEVMCSGDSEITKQVINLGGRATRFGLREGDLSTSSGRQKLFQILVRENPQDVWLSPVCAPWCKWNQFNMSKSLALCEKVLSDRWDSLWQLCLAVVLFRYQRSLGRHFHMEQPEGTEMFKVPCMQEVLSSLSWCKFDLCRLGNLKETTIRSPHSKETSGVHFVSSTPSILTRQILSSRSSTSINSWEYRMGSSKNAFVEVHRALPPKVLPDKLPKLF